MVDKLWEWFFEFLKWLRDLDTGQKTEGIIGLALIVVGAFLILHVWLTTKPDKSIEWKAVTIGDGQTNWTASWQDISVVRSEVWLCGALEWGGGGDDIGRGIFVHSSDEGRHWEKLESSKFNSGSGSFTWGPHGTRKYYWSDIGPITSIVMYRPTGAERPLGWITSSSGAYATDDGGATWNMKSPGPSHPDRYAQMLGMAALEGLSETYAVGWQGIAHWSKLSNSWKLELPTYYFEIADIAVHGGSENREVWAVGRAGIDEDGNRGDKSHGAVYRFSTQTGVWERVALTGIKFETAQALTGITIVDFNLVFVVGSKGIILRGTRSVADNETWKWEKLDTPTNSHLQAIAYTDSLLLVVGDDGIILRSTNRGRTWRKGALIKDANGQPIGLRRIRIFGDRAWIVGNGIVLRSEALEQ
jgi:hypothetical protein